MRNSRRQYFCIGTYFTVNIISITIAQNVNHSTIEAKCYVVFINFLNDNIWINRISGHDIVCFSLDKRLTPENEKIIMLSGCYP